MIAREEHITSVLGQLRQFPVVAVLGARQVGKTTLARQVCSRRKGPTHYYDLEDDEDRARLADPPRALKALRGLVVLDEIQHLPEVFSTLRVLADRPRKPARFLVLGSASGNLLRQTAESLAGRISYYELPGLDLGEVSVSRMNRLWLRGGFPRSFLARSNDESSGWRKQFLRTFLERDLPQFGFRMPATTMRRFWTMLAHYHGQVFHASELAKSLGTDHKSTRRYLDILTATFAVRQLQPWHANLKKRQVKSPKIYLADSGILHSLLRIGDRPGLEGHPKVGSSWEGFLMHQVLRVLGLDFDDAWFWSAFSGAELDLLVEKGRRRLGFEFKRTSAPRVTRSMRIAIDDLGLSKLFVVHAGEHSFPVADKIDALAASRIREDLPR